VDTMVSYAADRKAFGKPIAEFGQIQRYIGDSFAEAEAVRCLLYREAARVTPGSRNRLGTDAVKLFAAPAAKRIADNAMQVLGGYGYTREYKIERFLRDAKLNEIGGGTLESHQKNITRDLVRDRSK
jgi:isovaleryl-CoA dehydrogenase